MAEGEDDQTEAPTPRRLERAFEDGDVAISREAVGVAGLLAGLLVLPAVAETLRDALVGLVHDLPRTMSTFSGSRQVTAVIGWTTAVVAAIATCAAAATLLQTRGQVWLEKTLPDPTRLFSAERLGHLFSREFLVDVGLALTRAAAVVAAAWWVLRDEANAVMELMDLPAAGLLQGGVAPTLRVARAIVLALALLAVADVLLVRRRFHTRLRMTKDEVRRENKEEDGDPLLRGRRRRRHRELSKGRASVEVPRADALVVNPTHVAVAIRYRKEEGGAPRVVAKGKGQLAEIMRELAHTHGIPIVEDVPLARLLYRRVKVGREVPAETYRAVAAVLAFVYRLTRRTPGASGR